MRSCLLTGAVTHGSHKTCSDWAKMKTCSHNHEPLSPAHCGVESAHLVLRLQRDQLTNSTEGKGQSEDFLFGDVGGKLTQVKDPGRDALSTLRNTQPISAIHCTQKQAGKSW